MTAVQVVPLCDLVVHNVPGGYDDGNYDGGWLVIEAGEEPDVRCVCSPRQDLVATPGRPDGWIVVHHSLDGREVCMPPPTGRHPGGGT